MVEKTGRCDDGLYSIKNIKCINNGMSIFFEGDFSAGNYYVQIRALAMDKFYNSIYVGRANFKVYEKNGVFKTYIQYTDLFKGIGIDNTNARRLEIYMVDKSLPSIYHHVTQSSTTRNQCIYEDGSLRMVMQDKENSDIDLIFNLPVINTENVIMSDNTLFIMRKEEHDYKKIWIKRRMDPQIVYADWRDTLLEENGIFSITIKELLENFKETAKDKAVYDFFAELESEKGYKMFVPITNMPKEIDVDLYGSDKEYAKYNFHCYNNRAKRISLYLKRWEYATMLDDVTVEEGTVKINASDKMEGFRIYRKYRFTPYPDYGKFQYLNEVLYFEGNEFKVEDIDIPLMDKTEFVIKGVKNDIEYLLCFDEKFEYEATEGHFNLKFKGGKDGLFLTFEQNNRNTIPLVLLNSCIGRRMMASAYSDYYKLFRVVKDHFWTSMISMTADPVPLPAKRFEGWEEKEMVEVNIEFRKTLFEELKKVKFDYLLMDVFTDAIHGARIFSNRDKGERIIGYKGHARNMFAELFEINTEQYYININNYFEIWKEAADRFMDRLLEIIPENKIILVLGGFTNSYYKDGEKLNFTGMSMNGTKLNKDMLGAKGDLWNRMNAYLMTKYPRMLVLNTKDYEYCGNALDKNSNAPYHFERNMYYTQVAELSKLILWDKLNLNGEK